MVVDAEYREAMEQRYQEGQEVLGKLYKNDTFKKITTEQLSNTGGESSRDVENARFDAGLANLARYYSANNAGK